MKCKTCGNDLQVGVRVCPYCGSSTATSRLSKGEFKWNVQDFPKPRKQGDFSVDWNSGKIMDKSSQKIFDRDLNEWSTPKAEDIFAFGESGKTKADTESELKNSHKEDIPAFDFSSVSGSDDFKPVGTTDGTTKKNLNLSDDFLSWGNADSNKFSMDEVSTQASEETDKEKSAPNRPKPYTADWNFEDEPEATEDESFLFKKFDPGKISEIPNAANSIKSETVEHDEQSVLEEFKKLINAERNKEAEKESFSYMSDDEINEANAVLTRAEKLKASPEFSFSSLENEYYRYCEDNGIEPAKDKSGNKEVEIKINEPSGTKVTVKTQEIDLVKIRSEDDVKTREVEIDKLRQGPKNVQVSVEVNSASGNASVEVTRNHDGATIVKTVDEAADEEHVYIDSNSREKVENTGGEAFKDEKFWNPPSNSTSRMTITDIFGPEARKIMGKRNKSKNGDRDIKGMVQKNLDDSLMLDIKPEDIALSEEQTRELMLANAEGLIDEIPDFEPDIDETDIEKDIEAVDENIVEETFEKSETEPDIVTGEAASEEEIEAEKLTASDTGSSEFAGIGTADGGIGDELEAETSSEESKEADEKAEEGSEEAESKAEISAETGESDSKNEQREEQLSEENPTAEESNPEFVEDGEIRESESVLPTDEIISDSEGQTEFDKNPGKNQIRDTQEKPLRSGFTKSVKVIIAVLTILLVMEFAVIGIKLFASGSQADVFIDRVEDHIIGIFDKNDN